MKERGRAGERKISSLVVSRGFGMGKKRWGKVEGEGREEDLRRKKKELSKEKEMR